MKEQIAKMKLDLKETARQIKEKKKQRKNKEITQGTGCVPDLLELRIAFRHKHVAYCLARGRTIDQCDSTNKLNKEWIDWILRSMDPESKEKLYVVVNEKLSPSHQAVQAGHAVAAFLKKYPYTQWSNGHLIYLKDSPNCLGNMPSYSAYDCTSEHAEFVEPDLGDKVTACAIFSSDTLGLFKKLKLV
jgi:hypothetical protein